MQVTANESNDKCNFYTNKDCNGKECSTCGLYYKWKREMDYNLKGGGLNASYKSIERN